MTALELSTPALGIARKNIEAHGLGKKIRLVRSDLFGFWSGRKKEKWDLIVSNPPYIPEDELPSLPVEVRAEPRLALDGGRHGLAVIEKILEQAPLFLEENGRIALEIGKGQSRLLKAILRRGAFLDFKFIKDFTGIDRILIARKTWTDS